MERHFFDELASLKERLLRMGAIAEEMVNTAIKALVEHDNSMLESIKENENNVNHLQVDIDERCLKLTALHQPTASDLRLLLGVIKINSELERIADNAVNVSQEVINVLEHEQIKPFIDMPKMVEIVNGMFRGSLRAFIDLDVDKAKAILLRDDQVDDLRYKIKKELLDLMVQYPEKTHPAMSLILIANKFEKIADHATNIAEVVIFVAEGIDVRHHFQELP